MVSDQSSHIVKAYDEDLDELRHTLLRMGALVEIQLRDAMEAITRQDLDKAASVSRVEKDVDAMEKNLDDRVMKLLALRQPMANDLRFIIAILKSGSDLERIGDYAYNMARRVKELDGPKKTFSHSGIINMARTVRGMLNDCMDAVEQDDIHKLISVWRRDDEVDALYTSIYRELLTYMMEDPRNITPCSHLTFFAKNLERAADHITNVSELMYFHITGENLVEKLGHSD